MLKLKEERTSLSVLFLLIAIAYLFSVSMRFIWVDELSDRAESRWNNELMINTNDGYWFAEGARDLLAGSHQPNDLSGLDTPLAQLTATLARVLPISLETLILYMPAFFGSLLVIPLILIGRALNQTTMGFIAALIASIAYSYYNRTMAGYYDTDMLNIVFPTLEMFSLVLALTHQRNRYLIPIAISIGLYQWWYPQAYTLDTALFLILLAYTVIFERSNRYYYKIALFILIGTLAISLWIKVALAIAVFAFFHYLKEHSAKLFWPLFTLIVAIYFVSGGIDPIWAQIKGYILRGTTENVIQSGLHFYNVMSTVREAGNIPFNVFAERISGHPITFILAVIGYVFALVAYRPLIVTLPLVGLGFIAMSSGLRFTIYAVPMMAIGLAYLLMLITQLIEKNQLRYAALACVTSAALYPNYLHIKEYMVPTVLTNQEVAALDQLRSLSGRHDYVVTWWDYGYPIRYYSDVKTWIDGGKHTGDVNYPASFVLTTDDPTAAANLMRLYTEYTEKRFADTNKTAQSDFEYMMSKEGFDDPDAFLASLSLPDRALPKKTADAYLYLPLRMMDIFPTVALFSTIDLKTGESPQPPFFFTAQGVQDNGDIVELGSGVSIVKSNSVIRLGGQEVPIKSFYQVGYDQSQKLQVSEQLFSSQGLNVVFMPSYGKLLIVDDYYLNSTYFQMFVFERYDPKLFEPVILDPMTKIYRLKR